MVSGSGGRFDLQNGFLLELDRGGLGAATGRGMASVIPDTEIDFGASLFCGRESYSGSLDLVLQAESGNPDRILNLNPSGGLEFKQVAWSGSAVLAGQVFSQVGNDTRRKVRGWLDGSSLALAGDDPRDWRMQIRGRKWVVAELSQTKNLVIDDGSSLVGWSGLSGVGLATSGGVLVIDGGENGGSVVRQFSRDLAAEAYRFLRLRIRGLSGGGSPMHLRIVDANGVLKSWDFQILGSGDWQELEFDLCRPEGGVFGSEELVDEKESRCD